MNAKEAKAQADKDIRLELAKEGKTFITISVKQLIELQINIYEEVHDDADICADISVYIPNYRSASTSEKEW